MLSDVIGNFCMVPYVNLYIEACMNGVEQEEMTNKQMDILQQYRLKFLSN